MWFYTVVIFLYLVCHNVRYSSKVNNHTNLHPAEMKFHVFFINVIFDPFIDFKDI